MVIVDYQGRLGNRLFQYALGRILAEDLGYALSAAPIEGFPGTREEIEGDRIVSDPLVLTGQHVNLRDIHASKGKRCLILRGYFQRYELYRPWKEKIRSWFQRDDSTDLPADDLCLHFRGGDVARKRSKNFHKPIPYSFYASLLERNEWRVLHIVTDSPDHEIPQRLATNFGGQIRSHDELTDFDFLKSASRLILSASTFAWWAGWLSQAHELDVPSIGIWNRWLVRDIDLVVWDEPRFRYPRKWLSVFEALTETAGK